MYIEDSDLLPGNYYERPEFCAYRKNIEAVITKAKKPLSLREIYSAIGESNRRLLKWLDNDRAAVPIVPRRTVEPIADFMPLKA